MSALLNILTKLLRIVMSFLVTPNFLNTAAAFKRIGFLASSRLRLSLGSNVNRIGTTIQR